MSPYDPTALYREGLAHQQAGRLTEAIALYRQILSIRPDIPEVLFQLGRCLAEDDPKSAEDSFRRALKGKPKEPAIWQGLHSVLRGTARLRLESDAARAGIPLGSEADARSILASLAKGRAEQAEAAALRLTKLAPAAFWPVYALGLVRAAMGKPALAPLEAAHARDPEHPGATVALARACISAARPLRAEALLTGLKRSPHATLTLARLYRDTGRPEAAVTLLQNDTGKGPRGPSELALALGQTGQGAAAFKAARRAIAKGASVDILRATAVASEEAGDIAGAENLVDAALALARTAPVMTQRAQFFQSAGDFGRAEALLHQAMEADPSHGEAFRAYVNGRRVSHDDPVLDRLEGALGRADLKASDRATLHFAAAKARADVGDHAAVFPHLDTANRLVSKAHPYGFDADLQEARALVSDWRTLRDIAPDGPTEKVIFVTGLPRSGTTLVETILAAHPEVSAGGEMPFLGRALSSVIEGLRHGGLDAQMLAQAGRRYLNAAHRKVGPLIPADKAIATFSRIGHAARALPGAHFVVVKRDPRDVGLSLYRNKFPDGLHRYANDLTAIGRYIHLHDALTEFWQKTLPDRVHVIEYEALTADPESQIRAILHAVDLPWDPACLTPETSERRIQTLSFAQARKPITRAAVAGWRRYEADLAPLIAALEGTVDLEPAGTEAAVESR